MEKKKIVIATIKSWNIENAIRFQVEHKCELDVSVIDDPQDLTLSVLDEINPDYIFFPHWSYKIKKKIYEKYECIIFHTGNLPNDRGGSPIQNQIANKVYQSKICAVKVGEGFDEGDVYIKEDLDLSEGSAEDILKNISEKIFRTLIPQIINKKIVPKPQQGPGTYYKRRTPDMSSIQSACIENLLDAYDFVRMLDGEGYPKAFLEINNLRIELGKAKIEDGVLKGQFELFVKK